MLIKTKKRKLPITLFLLIIALFMALASVLAFSPHIHTLSAATVDGFTNVLNDLQTDANFKVEDYPTNDNDYSLKLIQVAETTGGQLFVYVYQPSAGAWNIQATSINISQGINDNLSYKNYKLTLLSHDGVFYKYSVNDFTLKPDVVRYYDIASIYRTWNEKIDKPAENDNTINEVVYPVAQLWTATTLNDEVTYTCVENEIITITDKFVGFVRYDSGSSIPDWAFTGVKNSCDRHFVAFNADRPIDKLIEADVSYQTQTVEIGPVSRRFGTIDDNYSHLSIDDNVSVSVSNKSFDGIGREFSYSWDNIQTVDQFVTTVSTNNMYTESIFEKDAQQKITDEALQTLHNYQWVLTFDNTDYTKTTSPGVLGTTAYDYTLVSNVTILRLKFEYNGVVYNLGVIDNKQTGSDQPINETISDIKLTDQFKKALKYILIGLVVAIVVAILAPFLPTILNAIVAVIKAIGYAIWYILKGIWWLFTCIFAIF